MLSVADLHNWINPLPDGVREDVLAQMQPRRYCDGEAVYLVGETANACYMIKSGNVRLCNYTNGGKEIQLANFRSGDCFGELGVIDDLPRLNNAFAVGDTLLLALSAKAFDVLYDKHGEIARQLNRFMSYRMRALYANAEDASVLTLKERLLRLIARLGFSRGVESDGVTVVEGVSHETLANMLGVTRQAVSRELKALEKSGLIELQYGKFLIPHITSLFEQYEQMISGEPLLPRYDEKPETR